MKIASIGRQIRGGAGLSSLKLHNQFLNLGHESKLFVAHETIHREMAESISTREQYENSWWRLGTVPLRPGIVNVFSSGLSGQSEDHLDEIYEWADVVLLRWVTATVSDYQIGKWSHGCTPIFWCLSDMGPFTGGCHYSRGCPKYEEDCTGCEIVAEHMQYYPPLVLKRRKKLWKNLHIVSPSYWLADCARKSAIFNDKEISIIRTGVELDVFRSTERNLARRLLGLPQEKRILCFGADSAVDERKGYDLLLEIFSHFRRFNINPEDFHLAVIGTGDVREDLFPFDLTVFGSVRDRDKISLIYSAADVTILPYKEDNLPNVMLESIACGTPVAAFSVGGMPDVIEEGVNGTLAIPFDTFDYAFRLHKLIESGVKQGQIREWAESNIDIKVQAKEYIGEFKRILAN